MSAVSDSNIILYKLRGELAEPLPQVGVLISVITEIELLGFHGISVAEEAGIRAFIAGTTVVPLNERIKEEAIHLRKTLRLRLPDAIVLATASVTNSELLTNDRDLAAKATIPCRSLSLKPRI